MANNVRILRNVVFDAEDVSLNIGLNILRSVRILQRIVRVVVIGAGGCDVRDHDRAAVAAEGVFEEAGEFGIAERYVIGLTFGVVLVEHVDAVAEGEERLVDVSAFDHPHAAIAGLGCSLGASEIDERKFADFYFGFDAGVALLVLADYLEDRVGSRGGLVRVGGLLGAVLVAVY